MSLSFFGVLVWFGYRGNAGLINGIGRVPSSSTTWESFRNTGINSFSNDWWNSLEKPSAPRLMSLGGFSLSPFISSMTV